MKSKTNNLLCLAPISGKLIDLESVNDPVFSKKVLGDGIAISADDNHVFAPIDGTLKLMFRTGHAFVIECSDGKEIMVHIGVDTVRYGGKGFHTLKSQGEHVQSGEVLVEFSPNYLKEADMTTMMIVLDTKSEELLKLKENNFCKGGEDPVLKWNIFT